MATILHVDMDAFFTSVEQRDRPELRNRPVVVGAPPDRRGVVAAASYEARKFGIHSAMPSREAYRRCPRAVFLPPDGVRYREASQSILEIFHRFTPFVEPLSIDEAFLDVTGSRKLFGDGPDMARRIKETVKRETGLTASVGVAPNKFLAKLASDMDKPDGLTVTPTGRNEIMRFLAPLEVGRLWGVGAATRGLLHRAGVFVIGDIQATPMSELERILGTHTARHLYRLAVGEDRREVETGGEALGISREHTFSRDCQDGETIAATLAGLVEKVGAELRGQSRYAALVRLKLRWKDFSTITRQAPLDPPACDDFTLCRKAMELYRKANPGSNRRVRLVGFGVGKLSSETVRQPTLFDPAPETHDKREALCRAVDALRGQGHGASIHAGAVWRGESLGRGDAE